MRNNKEKNKKILLDLLGVCGLIIFVVATSTFNVFRYGYFIEWIIMMVALIGTISGGYLTFCGVIYTINSTIEINEKSEKDKLQKEMKNKIIVFSQEMKAYENYIVNINKVIMEWTLSNYEDFRIWEQIDLILDNIKMYELIPNIKEIFYEIMTIYTNSMDEKDYEVFIKFYMDYQQTKFLIDNKKDNKSKTIINNLGVDIFEEKFLDIRQKIYNIIDSKLSEENKDIVLEKIRDKYDETIHYPIINEEIKNLREKVSKLANEENM